MGIYQAWVVAIEMHYGKWRILYFWNLTPDLVSAAFILTFSSVLYEFTTFLEVHIELLTLFFVVQVGCFDPYSDDPRLGIQKIHLCKYSGYLIVAGTAGQVK